ncbi:Bug family tripartite tricarboxylate transporter substrate binding protein [Roseomonas sp. BN140053]|uniref:Bug family tripartite tricarboxylate transporter substrate binding protein n=1 Tax=Roseomonas sp. BN140053 TaxID=3391898 RepID=UPI0039E72CD7
MPTPSFPSRRAILALGAAGALLPGTGRAQPSVAAGPVTIVVPYGAGTGPDTLARLVASVLQARLGQSVVVDNRPGASGNIASQAVARSAPDGRTLLMQTTPFVINPALFKQVPYDPVNSFTAIAEVAKGVLLLAVRSDLGVSTLAEFIAKAKAKPGGIDYASPGIGTPQHLSMALLDHAAGLQLNHVPYRTSPPAIQDLLGGRIPAMALPVHTAVPLARDGQIRMLALFSDNRAEIAPDVPTMAEAGQPGLSSDNWYGLMGPAGMPRELVTPINAAINAWLAEPRTREALMGQGLLPAPNTPDAFAALIASDLQRWATVIREAGITAE